MPFDEIMQTKPDLLKQFIKFGYQLIPLHKFDFIDKKGKQRGKSPKEYKGWPTNTYDNKEQIKHMQRGFNVGVRLTEIDVVLDVDPKNFAKDDNPLTRFIKDTGLKLETYPTVVSGSGGLHIYMKKAAEINIRNSHPEYQGLEFKSKGQQMVAVGSIHPETKRVYEWEFGQELGEDIQDVPNAPKAMLDTIAKPKRQSNKTTKGGTCSPELLADVLKGLGPEEFRGQDWRDIMMACHHATAGEGLDEFIEWSTRDLDYEGHDENIAKDWGRLDPNKPNAIKMATLMYILNTNNRNDLAALLTKTNAADDFDDDFLETNIVEAPADGNPATALVKEMNQTYCAVLDNGDFKIYKQETDSAYDDRTIWTKMSRETFRQYFEDEIVSISDSKRPISKADLWLGNPNRRKYDGIVLDPQGHSHNRGKLNLWEGWAVKPKPGDWSLMHELIHDVLCAGDAAASDYVQRWIAYMLQKPWETPEVAIAFRGSEGTGKGTLGRYLMEIAGPHGLTVSSRAQFTGRFNSHLRDCIFLFADEAIWPGDKEGEGTLKQLVTEPTIAYEAKGKDITSGKNMVHLMLASNEEWIVPAGKEARRFFVSDVSDHRKQDVTFFELLHKQMDNGGLAGMVHDLMNLDLGNWRPSQNIPQTSALADQKVQSLSPADKYWLELLSNSNLPFIIETEFNVSLEWENGPVSLGPGERNAMVSGYEDFLKRNRILYIQATHKAIVRSGKPFGLICGRSSGGKGRTWTLPKLSEMRQNFEAILGTQDLFD